MMREQDAVFLRQPEHPHRQPSDRARHAIAIQIQRRQIRGADVLRHIHLHAIDDGEEILAPQVEAPNRGGVIPQRRLRTTLIKPIDVVAPLLQRLEPLVARAVGIGDVVDLPAKAVDLEHRLALLARQNAHRRVERTAGRRGPVIVAGCGGFERHAPAAGFVTGPRPTARRVLSPAIPLRLKASSSTGPRCTRSLRGSRTFSMRTILSAKAWITAISSPSRKSFTSALSDLLSSSSASVRTASACRHCKSCGDALASPSASTDAPAAASASRGR